MLRVRVGYNDCRAKSSGLCFVLERFEAADRSVDFANIVVVRHQGSVTGWTH